MWNVFFVQEEQQEKNVFLEESIDENSENYDVTSSVTQEKVSFFKIFLLLTVQFVILYLFCRKKWREISVSLKV